MMSQAKKFFFGPALVMLMVFGFFAPTGLIQAEDKNFTGEVVQVAEQTIAPGEAELVISLVLPDGYELMREAPILAKVTSGEKRVIALGEASAVTCKQPQFPLRVPLKGQTGATHLQVDLVLYYCKTKGGGLCITKQVRLNLPVKVDKASKNKELRASYKIPAI